MSDVSREFSDPKIYDNSIDWDDDPSGSDGGYTRHGGWIHPDAMMDIVRLRVENKRLEAQNAELLEALISAERVLEWGEPEPKPVLLEVQQAIAKAKGET